MPANFSAMPPHAHLLPSSYKSLVASWLAEDIPSFDFAGGVVGAAPRTATLFGKARGVLAGVPFVSEVFAQCECAITWHAPEGKLLEPAADPAGDGRLVPIRVATVAGPAYRLLQAERVALNALARCSGVATASRDLVTRAREAGYAGAVAGTRKTTPGFRVVEKYGMMVGGADTHRMDLSSMVMLKDNHIWSCAAGGGGSGVGAGGGGNGGSGVSDAVRAARAYAGFTLKIEVEVQSEAQADEAIEAGADVVMLDNFSPDEVRTAARSLKERWKGRRQFLIEVSGGLTAENMEAYLGPDVDIVSTSSIHQGVPHVDFSLKINH